jgi:hypothetical protein
MVGQTQQNSTNPWIGWLFGLAISLKWSVRHS